MNGNQILEELPLTRADLQREKNYIDGRWVDSADRIEVRNPATGRIVGSIPNAGAEEAELAVAAGQNLPRRQRCLKIGAKLLASSWRFQMMSL